ncbi:MAG: hypothetical protein ACHQ1D_01145 [Nitrososphaerales archaeon]
MELLSKSEISELMKTPTISRDGFEINLSLVKQAAEFLGVKLPVKVKITSGSGRVGSHYLENGVHNITVSRKQSLLEINKTLWHELQHAADAQKWLEIKENNPRNEMISYRSVVTEERAIRCENTYGFSEWLVKNS